MKAPIEQDGCLVVSGFLSLGDLLMLAVQLLDPLRCTKYVPDSRRYRGTASKQDTYAS